MPGVPPQVVVLPVEEAELGAAEALVTHCYTGQLEAGVKGDVQELLRVCRLADRMQVGGGTVSSPACVSTHLRVHSPNSPHSPQFSTVLTSQCAAGVCVPRHSWLIPAAHVGSSEL